MKLGDMGAEVIKIETPQKGDDSRELGPPFEGGEASYYLAFNRNKKSLTLNLRSREGLKILKQLIAEADVLVENYRVGVMEQMGLGNEAVKEINPRLIYCSVSGYGQNSPWKDKASFDVMIQAESGFMSITGFEDGSPLRVGVALADLLGGTHAVEGILLALLVRQKTGRGQYIDVALMDTMLSFLTYQAGIYFATGKNPIRKGNKHPMITPYESFATSDGHMIIAAGNQRLWENLCQVLGCAELTTDARFRTMADRNINNAALVELLEAVTRQKTTGELVGMLEQAGIPCGRIRNLDESLEDEHVLARQMAKEVPHPTAGKVRLLGNPVKLSETPGDIDLAPPLLGQHTDEILQRLGMSQETIAKLKEEGVV
jgi:crotonobetainyl-CoA:carnitine CoA-transferase CaiB-like acyl-CoA transferase